MFCVYRAIMARRALTLVVATMAALLTSQSAPLQAKQEISGIWIDNTGDGAVEIRKCGSSMCGYIVWLKKALSTNGTPLTDQLNPKPGRRNTPICGLQVIGRLKPQTDGSWDYGWIYDPNKGRSYDVEVRRRSAGRLQVKGYLGLKLLSETFIWKRAPASIRRCSN